MRILAVLAHPKKDSLTGSLFHKAVTHFKEQGHTVDVLDLYEYADHIPFYVPNAQLQAGTDPKYDFYFENKERFMASDRLFIAYPVYWYAVPGILKCWLDLITNYAWKNTSVYRPTPLHSIKKALVINSAGMPNWYRWFFTKNSASAMLKESFKFLGISGYHFYEIGSTNAMTEAKVNAHIKKIITKCNWLIS